MCRIGHSGAGSIRIVGSPRAQVSFPSTRLSMPFTLRRCRRTDVRPSRSLVEVVKSKINIPERKDIKRLQIDRISTAIPMAPMKDREGRTGSCGSPQSSSPLYLFSQLKTT